jgi:hypothetical protein
MIKLGLILMLLSAASAWGETGNSSSAAVSVKKEAAIFPAYVEPDVRDIPSFAASLVDERVRDVLGSMKRFLLVPYTYTLDVSSVNTFIEALAKVRERYALADERFLDEQLGAIVIPGDALQRIVSSAYIFIPSITSFDSYTTNRMELEEMKDGSTNTNWVTVYVADAAIQVRVVDGAGKDVDRFTGYREESSEWSADEAARKALRGTVDGLAFQVRKSEAFRLRSRVTERKDGEIRMELGDDIGILPGWEFRLIQDDRSAGYVRVRDTAEEISWAVPVLGSPHPGDALLETPLNGIRIGLDGGVKFRPAIEVDSLTLTSQNGLKVSLPLDTLSLPAAPWAGLSFVYEWGFSCLLRGDLDFTAGMPFEIELGIGAGNEFYFGPVTASFSLDLVAAVAPLVLPDFTPGSPMIFQSGSSNVTFTQTVSASSVLVEFGLRPTLDFSLVLSQNSRLRLYGSLDYLPLRTGSVDLSGSGAETNASASIRLGKGAANALFTGPSYSSGDFPLADWGVATGLEWVERF